VYRSRLRSVPCKIERSVTTLWRNEKQVKDLERQERRTLADELDAERLRILTITNGAFQTSAKKLQDLAAEDLDDRRRSRWVLPVDDP
jgi:hypothetical protein